METITGIITEARNVRYTYVGNPIKSVTILNDKINAAFETLPNAQLGYMVGNYIGKRVHVTLTDYRGKPRLKSVELA